MHAGERRKYSPEFKSEAVRLVIETSHPIVEVARETGVREGTLGAWVNKYRTEHADDEPPLSLSERARLRGLEREVRELRMRIEFLGKGAPRDDHADAALGMGRWRQPAPTQLRIPGFCAVGGRGLVLVDKLSRSWGTAFQLSGGKVVWALLTDA